MASVSRYRASSTGKRPLDIRTQTGLGTLKRPIGESLRNVFFQVSKLQGTCRVLIGSTGYRSPWSAHPSSAQVQRGAPR